MPWKRRNHNVVTLRQALLLAGLAAAGGVLACWLSSASEMGLEFLVRRAVSGAQAAAIAQAKSEYLGKEGK